MKERVKMRSVPTGLFPKFNYASVEGSLESVRFGNIHMIPSIESQHHIVSCVPKFINFLLNESLCSANSTCASTHDGLLISFDLHARETEKRSTRVALVYPRGM